MTGLALLLSAFLILAAVYTYGPRLSDVPLIVHACTIAALLLALFRPGVFMVGVGVVVGGVVAQAAGRKRT